MKLTNNETWILADKLFGEGRYRESAKDIIGEIQMHKDSIEDARRLIVEAESRLEKAKSYEEEVDALYAKIKKEVS